MNHEMPDELPVYTDAINIFQSFCENHLGAIDNVKKQKLFSIKQDSFKEHSGDTYRAFSFVIRSGSYGVEADMTNRSTKEIVHHRSKDEADIKEFHCVVYIPYDIANIRVEKGIMIFESISVYGAKTITIQYLRDFLAQSDIKLETRSVSVRSFIEKLTKQGKIYKLELIRNKLSSNNADSMLISTGCEITSYIRPNFKPDWIEKMLKIFDNADKTEIYEIPDTEDYDDVAVQFKLGNRARTVRLKNLDKISIVEDIPDDIVSGINDDQIIDYMIKTAYDYSEEMIFGTRNNA